MASITSGVTETHDAGNHAQGLMQALDTRDFAVAEVDPLGRIRWATPLFARLVGRPGQPLVDVDAREVWPATRIAFTRVWQLARENGSFSFGADFPDGHRRTLRFLASGAGTAAHLWIEPADDGRGRRGDTNEIERLRELNEMRIHFINTAAHEFATPLTPLRLQTSLLLGEKLGPLNDRQRKSVTMLDRNLERLGQLVRDVMDVSRIEAGRFQVQLERLDLSELGRQSVESFIASAEQAGVRLSFEGPSALAVQGDKDRLTQVFVNLLSNALKFTSQGGRITVNVRASDANALVEVEDNGRGIPPEKIGKLFQPFSQVHDTSQETRSGTGLGLSICQGIVNQHGGRMWADSLGLGKGARFSVLIPLDIEMPVASTDVGPGPHEIVRIDRRGRWNLFYFKCPTCGSRDIDVKLLKNRYDCNQCHYSWK